MKFCAAVLMYLLLANRNFHIKSVKTDSFAVMPFIHSFFNRYEVPCTVPWLIVNVTVLHICDTAVSKTQKSFVKFLKQLARYWMHVTQPVFVKLNFYLLFLFISINNFCSDIIWICSDFFTLFETLTHSSHNI